MPQTAWSSSGVPNHWVKAAKDGTPLAEGQCQGLNVGVAGTANIVDGSGATLANFPLQAGYNPISVRAINAGGTADDIWAGY